MGAPNTKQSTTLRYSRLLSFVSITVSLFMLGALGLVYALEQGLSGEVRERVSFTVELPREGELTAEEAVAQLRALPYVRQVELISSDSAARSLTAILGEDPTKVLGYNPLPPLAKVHLHAAYTHPDSLRLIARQSPLLRTAEELNDQGGQWASAAANLQTIRMVLWCILVLNLLVSYRLGKSWFLSARWRYIGGAPYTPIDMVLSTNKDAWAVTHRAYPDYERFNTLRLPDKHQLDLRLDKEFYFKHWMLNLYVDIQNAYLSSSVSAPIYTNLDTSGRVMDDPTDPSRHQLRKLDYYSKLVLPTLGLIVKL